MNTTNKTLLKFASKSNILSFNGNYAIYFKNDVQFITPSNPGKFVNGNFVNDPSIKLTDFEVPIPNCAAILEGQKLEDLKPWIKKAFKFVGKDDLRPICNGVYIDKNCVVATDCNILYKKQFEHEISSENIILNALICQLIDDVKAIYKYEQYNDKFVALLNCGTYITYCNIHGKYPNYNAVIPDSYIGSFNINCASTEYKEALKLNQQETNSIRLNLEKNCFDWENLDSKVNGKINVLINENTLPKTNELLLLMHIVDIKTLNFVGFNQKLIDKISKATNQIELNINYNTNKPAIIYLPETTNKPNKTKKVMQEKPKQSVDNDILSALMQQINALSLQVAELKNQQISTPKIEAEPIKEIAKIEEQKPVETVKPVIHVQKYSDKSLIVYGDTKQIKDQLMQLHARFNPYLKLNDVKTPGWIVSVKQEEKLNQIVQAL